MHPLFDASRNPTQNAERLAGHSRWNGCARRRLYLYTSRGRSLPGGVCPRQYRCLGLICPTNPQQHHRARGNHLTATRFCWHSEVFSKDRAAPLVPGTVIHIISWHDNSSQPSSGPTELGRLRPTTIDEMGFSWLTG